MSLGWRGCSDVQAEAINREDLLHSGKCQDAQLNMGDGTLYQINTTEVLAEVKRIKGDKLKNVKTCSLYLLNY